LGDWTDSSSELGGGVFQLAVKVSSDAEFPRCYAIEGAARGAHKGMRDYADGNDAEADEPVEDEEAEAV
jgi:hypothetical protein